MLQRRRHGEVREDHDEHEQVVDRERLLDQVAGQELGGLALRRTRRTRRQLNSQRQADPHARPDQRLAHAAPRARGGGTPARSSASSSSTTALNPIHITGVPMLPAITLLVVRPFRCFDNKKNLRRHFGFFEVWWKTRWNGSTTTTCSTSGSSRARARCAPRARNCDSRNRP